MAKGPPTGRIVERKSGRTLKPMTVYLDTAVYRRLKAFADREGRQMSRLIQGLVERYLDEVDGR